MVEVERADPQGLADLREQGRRQRRARTVATSLWAATSASKASSRMPIVAASRRLSEPERA